MKLILIGANGKIGELVQKALAGAGHEIVKVGHKSGDFQVEIENRESIRKLYQSVGLFDAVAIAAGAVVFAPLSEFTAEKWQFSLGSKLMGQINLVQEAIPFIKEKGSFTLVSGILNDEPILAGVAASTVSGALEAFVRAAAIELPKGLRINVVSPTMLKESESQFAQFFIGMIPVEGWKVGQAYKRAILGAQTGCQGRSKTRPLGRSKSRPVVASSGCWVCGVEGPLERSGRGPSTPRRVRRMGSVFCGSV